MRKILHISFGLHKRYQREMFQIYTEALSYNAVVINIADDGFIHWKNGQDTTFLHNQNNLNLCICKRISVKRLFKIFSRLKPDYVVLHETSYLNKIRIVNFLLKKKIPIILIQNIPHKFALQRWFYSRGISACITSNKAVSEKSFKSNFLYLVNDAVPSYFKNSREHNSNIAPNFNNTALKNVNIGCVIYGKQIKHISMLIKAVGSLIYLHNISCTLYIEKRILSIASVKRLIDMYNLQDHCLAVDEIDSPEMLKKLHVLCLLSEKQWHDLLPIKASQYQVPIAYYSGIVNETAFEEVLNIFTFKHFRELVSIISYIAKMQDQIQEMMARNSDLYSSKFSLAALQEKMHTIFNELDSKFAREQIE